MAETGRGGPTLPGSFYAGAGVAGSLAWPAADRVPRSFPGVSALGRQNGYTLHVAKRGNAFAEDEHANDDSPHLGSFRRAPAGARGVAGGIRPLLERGRFDGAGEATAAARKPAATARPGRDGRARPGTALAAGRVSQPGGLPGRIPGTGDPRHRPGPAGSGRVRG